MAVGGMAERLVNLAKVLVGFIRGGMALVNIVASTMFGCISGSSVADTAAVGSVMIPQMIKNGYPRLFAVNVTISGSLQPLLLPPSHNMIIYSLAAGGTISVAHLFMAGVYAFPMIGALVADRWAGKYKTILYLSLVYCVGQAVLAIYEGQLWGMYLGLTLVAIGLTNKAIAQRLAISDHTVKFHVAAILAKLGAESRTEAVHLAARRGLLTL